MATLAATVIEAPYKSSIIQTFVERIKELSAESNRSDCMITFSREL